MRCYFIRNGHIAAVEVLPGLTYEEAVVKARKLFSERKRLYEGFEVWDRTRFLMRYPPAELDQSLDHEFSDARGDWHSQ
jgi:hypothetical protein